MEIDIDTKVLALLSKHHWYLALQHHEYAQMHREYAEKAQVLAESVPSCFKEQWMHLAKQSTTLERYFQDLADSSLALSSQYRRIVQRRYAKPLITEFVLLPPLIESR